MIFDFWVHQITSTNAKDPNSFSEKNVFGNLRVSNIEHVGKDACRKVLEIRLIRSQNLEYGINILKKKHKMGTWYV